jgi:hypothetical protein
MPKENIVQEWVIYAGPRLSHNDKIIYLYFRILSLSVNDGKTDISALRHFRSDTKLFKGGSIGGIYQVKFRDDLTIVYSPDCAPCDFWKNDQDRTEWRAHEVAYNGARQLKSTIKINTLIEALQPIRNAYRQQAVEGKRAILAEVIRVITT